LVNAAQIRMGGGKVLRELRPYDAKLCTLAFIIFRTRFDLPNYCPNQGFDTFTAGVFVGGGLFG